MKIMYYDLKCPCQISKLQQIFFVCKSHGHIFYYICPHLNYTLTLHKPDIANEKTLTSFMYNYADIIHMSFLSQDITFSPYKGMHGYDNVNPEMRGIFRAVGPGDKK